MPRKSARKHNASSEDLPSDIEEERERKAANHLLQPFSGIDCDQITADVLLSSSKEIKKLKKLGSRKPLDPDIAFIQMCMIITPATMFLWGNTILLFTHLMKKIGIRFCCGLWFFTIPLLLLAVASDIVSVFLYPLTLPIRLSRYKHVAAATDVKHAFLGPILQSRQIFHVRYATVILRRKLQIFRELGPDDYLVYSRAVAGRELKSELKKLQECIRAGKPLEEMEPI